MKRCCTSMYRRGNDQSDDSDHESGYPDPNGGYTMRHYEEPKKRPCWLKCLIWTLVVFLILLLLAFLTIFVIFPIVFMETESLQRMIMFPNFDQPENPQYENYALYNAEGVRNLYITVDDVLNKTEAVSLGVWQVVPEDRIEASKKPGFDYDDELLHSTKPICIYFHGNSGTRIYPYPTYKKLRKFFHVLAVDYRSYGDSTAALLTEEGVVGDLVQFFEKVKQRTRQEHIYFWAHSLGTALSTHALRKITENYKMNAHSDKRLPRALMLEAPFTTMREEVPNHPIGKFFAWLPWFEATILDPLEENHYYFRTTTNILSVDCPIMIVHAMDDSIIPWTLGKKLADVAKTERDLTTQGDVTLHIVPESARCDHMNINTYIDFEKFIGDFIKSVDKWWAGGK